MTISVLSYLNLSEPLSVFKFSFKNTPLKIIYLYSVALWKRSVLYSRFKFLFASTWSLACWKNTLFIISSGMTPWLQNWKLSSSSLSSTLNTSKPLFSNSKSGYPRSNWLLCLKFSSNFGALFWDWGRWVGTLEGMIELWMVNGELWMVNC